MEEKMKAEMIAQAENVEAIRDFLSEWYNVEQLYETMAKACTTIIHLSNKGNLCDEDKKVFSDLANQHEMMIDLIKPFARKGDEA